MIDHEELLQTFRDETAEGLSTMEEALMSLERRPDDREALATVFRQAHTLKGNAAIFGFSQVTDFAHVVEDLLERLRNRELSVTSEIVTALLQAVDALRSMTERAGTAQGEAEDSAAKALLKRLTQLRAGTHDDALRAAPSSMAAARAGRRESTLRVDLAKLDHLLNLTGEISVARGRLTQMLSDSSRSREEAIDSLHAADQLYTELQELVMKLRMVPIGPTFRQHARTVRDLASTHGKAARLEIEGDDVEVDTTVIEHLRDPLTHMIRNALDHGIEPPDVRRAAGKDPSGLLRLFARHDGGTIVIELADDGAGLDRDRILERARSQGLVAEADDLSDREMDQLIFEPGFSTADQVTRLSGRGVGMDVVRRNIETLRGTVGLQSRPGEGTRITIRLPLTLAIIEGLHVGIGQETYIIPMDHVTETLAFQEENVSRSTGRGIVNLRGTGLPCIRLRKLLGLGGAPPRRESAVVVEHDHGLAGLVVDVLHGESQTVIKPLARIFRNLPGLSGSAILGNGRVAFILDVATLLQRLVAESAAASLETH